MNCQETLKLLYDVIDKEASQVDVDAFNEHLESCRDCFDIYRIEESFHKFVLARARSEKSVGGAEELRRNVLNELDKIDLEESSAPAAGIGRSSASGIQKFLSIAATLLLVLGAGTIGRNIYIHQERYVPIEQAHWGAEAAPQEFDNQELTSINLDAVLDEFMYRMAARIGDFSLVGGNVEEVMGVKMKHFLYTSGENNVSVFVAPAAEFDIPDELYGNVVQRNGKDVYEHYCRGCRLVYYRVGDAVVVTATTDKNVELLEFIPGTAVI